MTTNIIKGITGASIAPHIKSFLEATLYETKYKKGIFRRADSNENQYEEFCNEPFDFTEELPQEKQEPPRPIFRRVNAGEKTVTPTTIQKPRSLADMDFMKRDVPNIYRR